MARNHENPIAMVRASSKRLSIPETLTAEEFLALLSKLPERKRAIGTICATIGRRVSETPASKWEDVDFRKSQVSVLRSVVDGAIGNCKSGSRSSLFLSTLSLSTNSVLA